MTKMYKRMFHVLIPVISAFIFVTIITVNPTTVTGNLNTELKTAKAVLPEVVTSGPKTSDSTAISTKSENSVPTPDPTPASATTPTPAPTPVQKEQTQPSTSSNTSTSTPTNSPTPPKTSSQSGKANAIIATSKQYIGVNYLYGGTTPAGFDCSGFVQYAFAENDIVLPRVSRDQYNVGTSVSFNNLQPGDLVFFSFAKNGVVDHVGIHVGNGQFINASSSKGVTIYPLGPYWQSIYVGAKRVI